MGNTFPGWGSRLKEEKAIYRSGAFVLLHHLTLIHIEENFVDTHFPAPLNQAVFLKFEFWYIYENIRWLYLCFWVLYSYSISLSVFIWVPSWFVPMLCSIVWNEVLWYLQRCFFLFRIILAIWDFVLHMDLGIIFLKSVKNVIRNSVISLTLDHFQYWLCQFMSIFPISWLSWAFQYRDLD